MDNMTKSPPSRRVLRLPQACEKTGLCRSTIHALVARGLFPRPFPLIPGGRAVGWYEDSIDEYLQQRSDTAGKAK